MPNSLTEGLFGFKAVLIGVLFIQAVASACFTAFIAGQKGRGVEGWFFLGLLFPIIALMAVGFSSEQSTEEADAAEDAEKQDVSQTSTPDPDMVAEYERENRDRPFRSDPTKQFTQPEPQAEPSSGAGRNG